MIQSYNILGDRSLRIPFWTEVQGWCNPTTFSGTEASGYLSEPKFKDDAILPHSWGPKSLDLFWTDVPGWYNPSSFSMTEVTGSLLDKCPRMIQSLFILEDRGHRITLGQVPRDDTIPRQYHYSPFRGRYFWTTPILSQKCSNFTQDRGFLSTSTNCSSVLTYWSFMDPFYIICWM